MRGATRAREVGGVGGRSRAPQTVAALGAVPLWDAFPVVNRLVVQRLLGLLVERMATRASGSDGTGGGERGGHACQALGAGAGQGSALAS
jgi:hypothetical protein